jgi:DNA-binding GntR family transcriptional regulator
VTFGRRQAGTAGTDDIADEICSSISQAIVDRLIEPGSKLPEDTIGGHFGVSRTIVRTAMIRLQRERLVEFKKNRGAFVARPTIVEARNLYDARRVLERAVVERVIDKVGPKDIALLVRHTEQEEEAYAKRPREAVVRLSGEFHVRLAELAGNDVLHDMVELLVRRSALVIALYGDAHGHACGAAEHRLLVDAIAQRNVAEATRIMETHLKDIEGSLNFGAASGKQSLIDALSRYSRAPRKARAAEPS